MNYIEAREYLISSYGADKKRGMDKVREALALWGNPQEDLRIIHVAGTNGKGSVCAMMMSILAAAGYRAGCFTSPHLQTFNERLRINGEIISNEDFAKHMTRVKEVSIQVLVGNTFSYFEILVLMAFSYFHEQNVDFLVLEVGIGGRLDATNVITSPLLSIITSIGMDHMDVLGNTIESIAKEKGGIIKENCPVVLYHNPGIVYNIMEEICLHKNADMYYAPDLAVEIFCHDLTGGIEFSAKCKYFDYPRVKLNLLGDYQVQNAATCLLAVAALADKGINLQKEAVLAGLEQAFWPGRMELAAKNPALILEGAHNMEGAIHGAAFLQKLAKERKTILLMGIMADKEYEKIVNLFAPIVSGIVFTKPKYDVRAASPEDLAACLHRDVYNSKTVIIENDCIEALARARELAGCDGVVFCTGSLYLVGDIRAAIM